MAIAPTLRRLRLVMAIVALFAMVGFIADVALPAHAAAQLTPIDDEPGNEAPGLGDITGSPDAGPEPEDAGDRGGWAQLVLAGVLFGGVLFIGSRILRESRRGRSAANQRQGPSPDAH